MNTKDAIYNAIVDYWQEHNYAPSVRDIGAAVGIGSTSHVRYHLGVLADEGRILMEEGLPRTVRPIHLEINI